MKSLWAIALAAFVVAPVCADDVFELTGRWTGTYQSALNPRVAGTATLDITMEDASPPPIGDRRFVGEVVLISLVDPGPCRGTVSAQPPPVGDRVTFIADPPPQNDRGPMLLAHGVLVGDVMVLDYMVNFMDGTIDRGNLVLTKGSW
jgi:hypothetical protein